MCVLESRGLIWVTLKDAEAKISRYEEELQKEINSLQRLVESSNIDENEKKGILDALDPKNVELEKLIEYRTKGSILRAKYRWHNEGEKNAKKKF